MDFGEILSSINYWAILAAALSNFVIGSLWYGPFFGKKWMKLNGFTEESLKEGIPMPTIMIANFIATLFAAFAIAMFLGEESDMAFGIFAGFMISVFWISTSRLNNVLYEKEPLGLFFIHAGYNLCSYIIMGAIIGAWH